MCSFNLADCNIVILLTFESNNLSFSEHFTRLSNVFL